jgi:hypothetical protein
MPETNKRFEPGKTEPAKQPCANVQTVVFVSQVYAQVNGPKKIPDPESFHLVKTRCGIEHKDFEEVVVCLTSL